jgi:hypothetical protein
MKARDRLEFDLTASVMAWYGLLLDRTCNDAILISRYFLYFFANSQTFSRQTFLHVRLFY